MCHKAVKRVFILLFVLGLLASDLLAYQAEVENVSSDKYFQIVLDEINHAKSSIRVYMYVVVLFSNYPQSPSFKLVDAVIQAKKRGVDVRVILDQSFDQRRTSPKEKPNQDKKNENAYDILKKNGVRVYFDDPATTTHAKTVIIDNETVILGSSNWTKAALTWNNETNVLIRSKRFAEEILADLKKVKEAS